MVTLEHIECNAACDYAPVVMVNWEFFDNQTPSSAEGLVAALRSGEQVTPTRGATLRSFRHTARTLAGLPDPCESSTTPARRGDTGRAAGPRRMRVRNDFADTGAEPLLDEPQPWTLPTYLRHDGYQGLRKALRMKPDDVIATVKDSGLRGRGGAGFHRDQMVLHSGQTRPARAPNRSTL